MWAWFAAGPTIQASWVARPGAVIVRKSFDLYAGSGGANLKEFAQPCAALLSSGIGATANQIIGFTRTRRVGSGYTRLVTTTDPAKGL